MFGAARYDGAEVALYHGEPAFARSIVVIRSGGVRMSVGQHGPAVLRPTLQRLADL